MSSLLPGHSLDINQIHPPQRRLPLRSTNTSEASQKSPLGISMYKSYVY